MMRLGAEQKVAVGFGLAVVLLLANAHFAIGQTRAPGRGPGHGEQMAGDAPKLAHEIDSRAGAGTTSISNGLEGRARGMRILGLLAAGAVVALTGIGVFVHLDLRRRRQLEDRLREQASILQAVLNSMGEAVLVVDSQGRLRLFNPAARRMHQRGPTEISLEQWCTDFRLFLPDGQTPCPVDEHPVLRVLRGEPIESVELVLRPPPHLPELCLGISGQPIADEQGLVRGGVILLRDTTAQKKAETHSRQINEELDARVTRRTEELAHTNAELLQKQQENELFVYSVSHDLRSPLVNLQGFSQELSVGCGQLRKLLSTTEMRDEARHESLAILDDDLAHSVRFIQTAVTRLESIISALLRLSRAGKAEYHWQPVGVQKIVERIVESSQPAIETRGATVAIQSVPEVWGDPMAVEQVFSNLIGNALKYLDPARPGHVEIGSLPGAIGASTFFVRDNGLGIPDHAHGKVFRAFQRLHPELEGEGIGLAVVSRIVERHGGRSWLESKAGQGSTFFVALPACPAEPDVVRA